MKKVFLAWGVVLLLISTFSTSGMTKEFPERPIDVIVPFAPGGGTDVLARVVCPIWEKELGTRMVIINKDGGSGIVGYQSVLKAPHDGYTMILAQSPNFNINVLFQNAPYKIEDFEFISLFQVDYWMFFANKNAPWNSMTDLIADAKKRPGQIKVGLAAMLSMDPVFLKEFEDRAGIRFGAVIPMGGGAELRKVIIGEHMTLAFHENWVARTGKGLVKGLGVQMMQRSPIWPEAQTINEALPEGKKYSKEEVLFPALIKGFAVPAQFRSKYPERFERFVQTFNKAMKRPEWAEMVKSQEMETALKYYDPAESKKIVDGYTKKILEHRELFEKMKK